MRPPAAALTASAIPKSAIIGRPPCIRMFSGLMSRWITPFASARTRARRATSRATRTASSMPSCVSRLSLLAERLAFDVRHHVVQEPIRRCPSRRAAGCADGWSARRGLDLHHEALGAEHRCELGLEDLHRDQAVVLEVLGQIDGGHAARTELALDGVAVCEGGGETLEGAQRRSVVAGSVVTGGGASYHVSRVLGGDAVVGRPPVEACDGLAAAPPMLSFEAFAAEAPVRPTPPRPAHEHVVPPCTVPPRSGRNVGIRRRPRSSNELAADLS